MNDSYCPRCYNTLLYGVCVNNGCMYNYKFNRNPEPKPIKNIVVERFHESNLLNIYTADQTMRTNVLNVIHKYGAVINSPKVITLEVSPCWDVNTVIRYIENLA